MKMSSKQIEKLCKEHMERSAADMDALWEKIENRLEPKPENGVTSQPVRKRISTPALKWAVCVAALLIIPISVRIVNNSSVSKNLASGGSAQEQAMDGGFYLNDKAASAAESTEETRRVIFYEELFPGYENTALPAPAGKTSGDDFFVEENVLIETDVIVNAYIDRVYSKGDTVCYEITAENMETFETANLVIESSTPYVMRPDRSYLLPLKSENGEYRLVFENAPQIEFAEEGGLIFHNGWTTLDALEENPATVIYPQNGVDDFFYDRMMFSYSSDITPLVDEWLRLRQT